MEISKNCLRINRRLFPVKCHYFLFLAALACVLPFRTVFAKQLGISATAIGVIFCAIPFLKTITNPLFGFILDYFKRFRLTISVILVTVAVSHMAMLLIPAKIPLYQNSINITENVFYTRMKYSSSNETFPYICDQKFIIYNEYRKSNNSSKNRDNFACGIECSGSTNGITVTNRKNVPQCSAKIRFKFTVVVDVSSCNMDIRLEKGMIAVGDNDRNSISIDINNTSVKQLKSWILPPKNCSEGLTTESAPFSSKLHEKTEEKFSEGNEFKDADILGAFDFVERYTSMRVSGNLDDGKKQYYALHEFIFDMQVENPCANNCPYSLEFDCRIGKCFSNAQDEISSEKFAAEESEFLTLQFWGLFILFALSNVMLSAIMLMMDAVCYELLQHRRENYGHQRMWGSIGWGVGALAGGYLNQIIPTDSEEINYSPGFYLLFVLILINLVPVYHLKVTDLKYSSHIWKDVCFLFTKLDLVYNLTIVYFIGVLSGFIWNYQFWFMQEIGSSQVLLGLSQTFECMFEIPCFLVSGWIIKKIGHDHCNNITLLCFGLRYLCFVFMYNPWWTLAAGLLHAPTFGLFYSSMTMYAKDEAPPGTEATVQSLLHLCFEGIGVATGSILGGVGLDEFGSRMSFQYAAELSFLLLFINICMGILFSRAKKKSKQVKEFIPCS